MDTLRTSTWPHGRCYACDARATGFRDRRPEGGELEFSCPRHTDPTLRPVAVCIFCDEPVRKGSLTIDADHAHAACHRREVES